MNRANLNGFHVYYRGPRVEWGEPVHDPYLKGGIINHLWEDLIGPYCGIIHFLQTTIQHHLAEYININGIWLTHLCLDLYLMKGLLLILYDRI